MVITKATKEGHGADGEFGLGMATTRVTENTNKAEEATNQGQGVPREIIHKCQTTKP